MNYLLKKRIEQIRQKDVQDDEKLAHRLDRKRRRVSEQSERERCRDHLLLASKHDHQSS